MLTCTRTRIRALVGGAKNYASKHTRISNEHSEIELPTYMYSQPISKLITDC